MLQHAPLPDTLQISQRELIYRGHGYYPDSEPIDETYEEFEILKPVKSRWEPERTNLERRIINQPAAIDAIINALDRIKTKFIEDKRPVATLAFLGQTGVGKTETAEALTAVLGGDSELMRINCAEYSHGHEVANLIGAPPGFVGFDGVPLFSRHNIEKDKGFVVLLFDEVEKGADVLHRLMLGIMDKGKIRLNNGEDVNFANTIVIMTSNVGAEQIAESKKEKILGFQAAGHVPGNGDRTPAGERAFIERFSPEFINRITDIVQFQSLDADALGQILDLRVNRLSRAIEGLAGTSLSLSDTAREYIVQLGAQKLHLGARPLMREFDLHINTPLGRYMGRESTAGVEIMARHRDELTGAELTEGHGEIVFTARRLREIGRAAQLAAMPSPLPSTW